jgi:DNA (cytosine-5)-methyltransferase 1
VVGVPLDGRPLDTVTATDHHSLAAATLVKLRGECAGADPSEPMPTVTASGTHLAEVRAFLVAYYGEDHQPGQALTEPMRTITAKARLGIVTVRGVEYQLVDIGFRMLRSHELLRATCGEYADGYDLSPATTEEDRVRLIGNMVPPKLAEAVVRANLPRNPRRRRRSSGLAEVAAA